jgi:hypothetical protein
MWRAIGTHRSFDFPMLAQDETYVEGFVEPQTLRPRCASLSMKPMWTG